MAELVAALGVPHSPLLWRLMEDETATDVVRVMELFELFRGRLEAARPDVIVIVASDHFHQFTHENMPAFAIGKADRLRGTYPNEQRAFGLPALDLDGDPDLAAAFLGDHQLAGDIDFAFTSHPWVDHAYVVPLLFLAPGGNVPVVPIHTNTNAPPIPSAKRFADVGHHLRNVIDNSTLERRVAVVASGHLAFELGGPRQFGGGSVDPLFDARAVGWMAEGDIEGAVGGSSYEELSSAGNLSFQFLNFVTLLALADRPADFSAAPECRFGSEPFFAWTNR